MNPLLSPPPLFPQSNTDGFPGGHARRRRGLINGVGYVAHSLFGVLDDHFAEQYKLDINLVRHNQNHLIQLWKNQTSIIESEYNVLKRISSSIDKQHKLFNQYLNQLQTDTNDIKTHMQDIVTTNEFLLSSIALNGKLSKELALPIDISHSELQKMYPLLKNYVCQFNL
ncbi:unnamed protein product [Leptidea sinapis]|uniref:Uncharacterized protein n=1 Tax=Leptidea sinapis TaxID=189913 RepID=A0A5E4QP95_9NEOP|nr:unnamed protein product [Leptidea sinapis]